MKLLLKGLGVILLLLIIAALFNYKTIKRLNQVNAFFNEDVILGNFLHMEKDFDHHKIKKSASPTQLQKNISHTLMKSFSSDGKEYDVEEYLDYSRTTGLMFIHKDTIVFENYYNGMEETTTHISWSMAKSFVSALLGIALNDGLIQTIEDPITKYLPEFAGTGYDGVRIKDILQMSSGVGFNEDYRDFNSDINRFGRAFAFGTSFAEFAKSLKNEKKPGTFNHYVSIDTQVIGMLIKKMAGKSLSEYAQEKLWNQMGMEHDAQWIIDNEDMEMALGGLNVTLRDYSKLGLLFLNKGNWFGKQIVPSDWVEKSVTPDAPHLMPGENPNSSSTFGYGYQWWIPEQPDGDFFAAGIYNQYIYVNPKKDLVIVKTSANHHFKEQDDMSKDIHVDMFQAMAKEFENVGSVLVEKQIGE